MILPLWLKNHLLKLVRIVNKVARILFTVQGSQKEKVTILLWTDMFSIWYSHVMTALTGCGIFVFHKQTSVQTSLSYEAINWAKPTADTDPLDLCFILCCCSTDSTLNGCLRGTTRCGDGDEAHCVKNGTDTFCSCKPGFQKTEHNTCAGQKTLRSTHICMAFISSKQFLSSTNLSVHRDIFHTIFIYIFICFDCSHCLILIISIQYAPIGRLVTGNCQFLSWSALTSTWPI